MSKTAQIQIRIEPELKQEAEGILLKIGLSPTEYMRMSLRQLVMFNGLPFEARIPNAETRAALDEDLRNAKRFKSVDDLMADLNSDD